MRANWRELLADLAFVFHFQPSEMDEMPISELLQWHDQAKRFSG